MAGGFIDSFLNAAIPLGIFIFFSFKIYEGMQDPFDRFFAWIGLKIQGEEVFDPYAEQELTFR